MPLSNQHYKPLIFDANSACHLRDLPNADIIFITLPDDCIETIVMLLAKFDIFSPKKLFIHCSGALDGSILDKLYVLGHEVASANPMHNFANPKMSIKSFKGTFCALEGQLEALGIVKTIFEGIGAITFRFQSSKKALYHAGGVIASTYLVTLTHIATQWLVEAGVKEDIVLNLIYQLMTGTLGNLKITQSPNQVLIGPIVRGDVKTIKKHLEQLNTQDKKLYKILAKRTLPLTNLPQSKIKQVLKSLCWWTSLAHQGFVESLKYDSWLPNFVK